MPIRAEFRHLYRRQSLMVIRPRVLKRAHNQCERCRKPLHAWIFTYTWKSRDPQFCGRWRFHMIWIKEGTKVWRNQDGNPCSPLYAKGLPRKIRVKLTILHADNNPVNMNDLNLRWLVHMVTPTSRPATQHANSLPLQASGPADITE